MYNDCSIQCVHKVCLYVLLFHIFSTDLNTECTTSTKETVASELQKLTFVKSTINCRTSTKNHMRQPVFKIQELTPNLKTLSLEA